MTRYPRLGDLTWKKSAFLFIIHGLGFNIPFCSFIKTSTKWIFMSQIVGGAESHIPKESGEKETIIVKMNDFPKVRSTSRILKTRWSARGHFSHLPNLKLWNEFFIIVLTIRNTFHWFDAFKMTFLKDSVIYWRLRAEATSKGADGKYSLSNIASVYLVNVNKVLTKQL